MDIIDHIKQLDEEHGSKLQDLCINSNNYEAILEFYFGNINEMGRPSFEFSEVYHNKLAHFLYHKSLDFDEYIIYLVRFLNESQAYNLKSTNDGNYHIDDRLRISKTLNKNTFIYCSESTSRRIRITFSIMQLPTTANNAVGLQVNNTLITFDNFTITARKQNNTYFNKLFSKITPYLLLLIFLLVIIFSEFTHEIISLTSNLFDIGLYPKIATIIIFFCGLIIFNPIYNIIKALRSHSVRMLSFKINKRYSNAEKYINSFDIQKRQNTPLFENRERPISTPIEDFLGFNLLAASFYYNSIKDSFDSNVNLFVIIDAKKGMGKTSFINLLVHRVNGFTYRHENSCQLFKNLLMNQQINVVQFSIMPFLTSLNNNDEKIDINNFISFIAENLTLSSSKYLKAVLSSITAFDNKFNIERFISQITNNNHITKIKNQIKLSEQKNLIIIEDLDRLTPQQLKMAVNAFWFIHDLPFTITLLPAEEDKIKKAVNLSDKTNDCYEELEEYKLFQFAFKLKDYFYKLLANYALKIFNNTVTKWQINNELIQIKQLNDNAIHSDNIQNAWVSHLYKNNLIQNNAFISMRLNNNIADSIKNELICVFEKYNISLREFKNIITELHVGSSSLFIVQQVLFYMIYYRYKYQNGLIEYLNRYDTWGNFRKNHSLNFHRHFFPKNRLDSFSCDSKEMILALEQFPPATTNNGIMSFTISLFGFINRRGRVNYTRSNSSNYVDIFNSEFITVFLTNNKGGQNLYDSLSLNWHEDLTKLSINCSNEFILIFNERAETTVSSTTEDHKFSYNLFLYQNFAILLLIVISKNNNLLNTIINYFNGDKLYNHNLRIHNEFYDVTVSFDIDIMIDYFRRLFNLNHNNFEYDKTYKTLQNNYTELKKLLVSERTEDTYIQVLTKIFETNLL